MTKESMKKGIIALILVLIILLSIFVISPKASISESYKSTIQKLNEKQKTVLEMTGAASAASLALATIPGDATTPIANKIIDMAGYFIIILSVIILEKYMLTIAGYLVFKWLIPIACLIWLINLFIKKRVLGHLALKIFVFGISLVLIVPTSVKLTDIIEETNRESINTTMENVKNIQKEAEESIDGETEIEEDVEEDSSNPFGLINSMKSRVNQLTEGTRNALQGAASSVIQLSEQAIKKAQDTINDFVEVVVIMLVTTCGIPILTVIVFFFLIKSFLGIDLDKLKEKAE